MKAAIFQKYGPPDVLSVGEVEKPVPQDHEVLVKILATTVQSADWRVRGLLVPRGFGFLMRLIFGWSGPRQPILGTELVGVVEAVGPSVTRFHVGDRVVAMTGAKLGCHAEYRCLAENAAIEIKPECLSNAQAAALSFGGMTALDFLRDKAGIKAGDKVLIHGASGAVGSAAVQLATYFGADVTGVCSAAHGDFVLSLGARQVLDYKSQDFVAQAMAQGAGYDIILDTVGNLSFASCKAALNPHGRLLLISAGLPDLLMVPLQKIGETRTVHAGPASEKPEEFRFLVGMAVAGHFTPPVDRVFALDDIVKAHLYAQDRHKAGNVVIDMTPTES